MSIQRISLRGWCNLNFVNIRLQDLYVETNPVQLLPINHGYSFICIDHRNAQGLRFTFTYDSPQSGAFTFTSRPGSIIAIAPERSLYVSAKYESNQNIETDLSDPAVCAYRDSLITFWTLRSEENGAFVGGGIKIGERIRYFRQELSLGANSSTTIISSDDVGAAAIGVPLSLRFRAIGGVIADNTDIPIELVLIEDACFDDTSFQTSRLWLFPGNGILDVTVPFVSNYRTGPNGDTKQWKLVAHNRGAAKTVFPGTAAIFGEIIAGTLNYSTSVDLAYRATSLPASTARICNFNFSSDHCIDRLMDGLVVNGATAGILAMTQAAYIPGYDNSNFFGVGPRKEDSTQTNFAAASSTAFSIQACLAKHNIIRFNYTGAPVSPSVFVTLNLGGR